MPTDYASMLSYRFRDCSGKLILTDSSSNTRLETRDDAEINKFCATAADPHVDVVTTTGDAMGRITRGFHPLRGGFPIKVKDGKYLFPFENGVVLSGQTPGVHVIPLPTILDTYDKCQFPLDCIDFPTPARAYSIFISEGKRGNDKHGNWTHKDHNFGEFAKTLRHHTSGREDGPCYLQGLFIGRLRNPNAMYKNSIIALDVETGISIEELIETIVDAGLEAAIYTKYSHLERFTHVNRDKFLGWSLAQEPTAALMIQYLQACKGINPEIVQDLVLVDDARPTAEGLVIVVEHKPLPKFCAVFVLKDDFVFAERGGTKREAINEWKQLYAGFAAKLNVFCEKESCDPARLFHLPRHPTDADHDSWAVSGFPVNLDEYRRVKVKPDQRPALGASATRLSRKKHEDICVSGIANASVNCTDDNFNLDAEKDLSGRDQEEAFHLRQLNQRCAFVQDGGRAKILYEPVLASDDLIMLSVQDARNKEAVRNFLREKTGSSGVEKVIVFNRWLEWSYRRTYDGMTFHPGVDTPGLYNHFRGWPVEPSEGDWSIMRNHIYENICAGNAETFEWVLTWLAQIFQHPNEKPGSALVIRGPKGCGKSIVFDLIAGLLGPHFSKGADTRRLTGNFNATLDKCLLYLLEETHWSGDKASEGILKDIITSSRLMIERKGVDSELKQNFSRVVILSNESWIIPATADERRYAILECRDTRRGDHAYFADMTKQMLENGGLEAMLFDLLRYKPANGWHTLRQPPKTDGLHDQIIETLQGPELFMYELLKYGEFESVEFDQEPIVLNHDRPTRVLAKSVRSALDEFLKNNDAGRKRKPGFEVIERMVQSWTGGRSEMEDLPGMQNRSRILIFPSLVEARAFAELKQGVKFDERDPDPH